MAKLFENTFRAVNIGLANEMLLMCNKLGLDAWRNLDATATKPFGFMKFARDPVLAEHCIPIDPLYLSWKLRTMQYNARSSNLQRDQYRDAPLLGAAGAGRPERAGLSVKGSKVLVLGVACAT